MNTSAHAFRPFPAPLRALVPFCLALLFLAAASPASQVLRYLEQTGEESFTFFWRAEPEKEGMTISQRQGEETFTSLCAADGSTLSWRYTRTPDTDIRAKRIGDRLHFNGTFAGKAVETSQQIDTRPWFQPLSYSLQRVLIRQEHTVSFWTVRPDTLEAVAMEAEASGSEQIQEGTKHPLWADKVIIRPAGILSALWSAAYWFRQGDHLFVQYRGTHGPPGTAETVVNLLRP